jgi:phosphoglycolate phosphatase
MRCKAVLFDLDGTLLDTLEDIGQAMNRVLARHGLAAHPLSAYRGFVGDGAEVLVRRSLRPGQATEAEIFEYIQEFKTAYAQCWNVYTRPYPGIPQLLDMLAQRGIHKAVLSNKPHEFSVRCVEAFLPGWSFAAVLGEMPGRPLKPDPAGAQEAARLLKAAPREICYVGDTDTDMQTALAAGMLPVGALWGFRPAAELSASGAHYLIKTPAELLSLL